MAEEEAGVCLHNSSVYKMFLLVLFNVIRSSLSLSLQDSSSSSSDSEDDKKKKKEKKKKKKKKKKVCTHFP